MALLDDLADVLSSAGVATIGTTLFKGTLPSTPDEAIAIYQTGGAPPVHTMSCGPGTARVERPHVQAIARSGRADAAYKLAQDAYTALDALGDRTVNGVRYLSVFALQAPFYLREDQTGRKEFSVNFEVTREPATSS